MSADLYSDLTIGLGLKNYPILTPHMSKFIHFVESYDHLIPISADLYSDLAIGLALKNYPKMIPNLPHSFLSTNDPLWGEEGG